MSYKVKVQDYFEFKKKQTFVLVFTITNNNRTTNSVTICYYSKGLHKLYLVGTYLIYNYDRSNSIKNFNDYCDSLQLSTLLLITSFVECRWTYQITLSYIVSYETLLLMTYKLHIKLYFMIKSLCNTFY